MQKVTIISLGWLGVATYKHLEHLGFKVSGSYNSKSKDLAGEFKFDINKEYQNSFISDSDIIILNIPPSKITNDDNFLKLIKENVAKKIIFISSTSVYGMQGSVNELTEPLPLTKSGIRLLEWENYILKNVPSYQIIRSAGQIGPNRHPAYSLSGRKDITGGNQYINLISQKDLLDIITKSINSDKSRIINASNTNHPIKKVYYTQYCKDINLPLPTFNEENVIEYKKINTIHKEFEINTTLTKGL